MLGLALMLAIVLAMPMAVQAKTLDWGTEDLPTVGAGKTIHADSDILGISAANDGKTIYAVISDEAGAQVVRRSTDSGKVWWTKTPLTPTPTDSDTPIISHVAVSPDDPSIVVAAGTANVTGNFVNHAWISTDKGETWSYSNISSQLSGDITSLAISEERDDIRWVAIGSDGATDNKCLAVSKAEAFAGWDTAGSTNGTDNWSGWVHTEADKGVLAVAFSPWFNNDNTMLVVTATTDNASLQVAEVGDTWATCYFNAENPSEDFEAYPVEIGDKIVATAASISLPDTYYGYDAAERIAYIGTTDGVYRMDDVDSEKIKSGNLPQVAYNSEENQLLVGYSTSGRVDMSSNPDSGSPTFTRPASMKSPSGESVSGVAWVGTTMMASTKEATSGDNLDDESAISVSDDARAWNQISLIDTDLDKVTDVAVSEDGSKIYAVSQNSEDSFYSVWRYASGWERVLCDDIPTDQTGVIVRLAPEKPEVVFVGLVDTKEIRRSTDSGETWKQSRADIEIQDIAAKDDKVVHVVKDNGRVSTSTDGGRTFDDYVKSNVNARHMIVAANGDILIAGEDIIKAPSKISVALSTDDGATWSRMPITTGLEEYEVTTDVFNPLLVAADTDYATNNLIYIAHTDGDEANILRWEVGGDYEVWQDIGTAYYKKVDDVAHMTSSQVISGLVAQEGMLYIAYYSDNVSGFISTNCPTIKRTSVTWGGGPGTDAEVGTATSPVTFGLTPQALKLSSGSIKLWAVDSTAEDTGDRLYSYTDILGKVEAPTVTGPADGYKGTVDPFAEKINPVRFTWEEVNPDVSYQFRIAPNAAVSQNYITYSTGTSEFITLVDGDGTGKTYPFAAGDTYYWKVRVRQPTVGPWSETRSFTIVEAEAPVAPAPVVTVTPPEVTVEAPPAPQVTVEAPPTPAITVEPVIPTYLLWLIIGIGAVLIIALIILIVRTRRVV